MLPKDCQVDEDLKIKEGSAGYDDHKGRIVAKFVLDGVYVDLCSDNIGVLNNALKKNSCLVRLIKI